MVNAFPPLRKLNASGGDLPALTTRVSGTCSVRIRVGRDRDPETLLAPFVVKRRPLADPPFVRSFGPVSRSGYCVMTLRPPLATGRFGTVPMRPATRKAAKPGACVPSAAVPACSCCRSPLGLAVHSASTAVPSVEEVLAEMRYHRIREEEAADAAAAARRAQSSACFPRFPRAYPFYDPGWDDCNYAYFPDERL